MVCPPHLISVSALPGKIWPASLVRHGFSVIGTTTLCTYLGLLVSELVAHVRVTALCVCNQ